MWINIPRIFIIFRYSVQRSLCMRKQCFICDISLWAGTCEFYATDSCMSVFSRFSGKTLIAAITRIIFFCVYLQIMLWKDILYSVINIFLKLSSPTFCHNAHYHIEISKYTYLLQVFHGVKISLRINSVDARLYWAMIACIFLCNFI